MKKKFLTVMLAFCVSALCAFALTACAHEHEFSESWSTDETQHWHICTGDGCEEKSELGDHVFDNDCDTTCNECGYTRTIEHSYDTTTWKTDETGHWHECTVCGDKIDFVAHTESTTKSNASKNWHECTVCGYVIDENEHEFSGSWSTDETQHWHICIADGCEEKSELGDHVFDNDCDTTCNECGYTRTIEHSYDTTTWKTDETGHWHECTVCGDKIDFVAHTKSTTRKYDNSTHWYECTACKYKLEECEHEFLDENYNQEKDNLKCTYCNRYKDREPTYFSFEIKSYEDLNKYYTGSPVTIEKSEYYIKRGGGNDTFLTVTWKYKIGTQTKVYDGLPTEIGTYKVQAHVHGNAEKAPCTGEWKTLNVNPAHISLEKPLYTCMSNKNSELSFTLGHDDCSAIAPGESITIKTTLSYDYYYDTTYAYCATLKVKTGDSSTKNQYEEFVELQETGDYANYVLDTNFGKLEFKKHTYNEYGACSGTNNKSDIVCYKKNWEKGMLDYGADATTTITHEDRKVEAGEYSCVYLSINSAKIWTDDYKKEYAKITVGDLVGVEYNFYEVVSSWGKTSYRLIDTETEFDNGIIKLFDNNTRQYRGILISFKNTSDEAIMLNASITLEFYINLSVGETMEINQQGPVYMSATLTNDGDADKYFEFTCTRNDVTYEIVDFEGKTVDLITTAIASGETKVILIKLLCDGWCEFNVTVNEKAEAA